MYVALWNSGKLGGRTLSVWRKCGPQPEPTASTHWNSHGVNDFEIDVNELIYNRRLRSHGRLPIIPVAARPAVSRSSRARAPFCCRAGDTVPILGDAPSFRRSIISTLLVEFDTVLTSILARGAAAAADAPAVAEITGPGDSPYLAFVRWWLGLVGCVGHWFIH
jgi:hypothetical protein